MLVYNFGSVYYLKLCPILCLFFFQDLIPIEFRTGPEFLRIKDNDDTDVSNRVGLAQVKYQNVWGTICGEGWSYTEEFCKLKNSNWE